MLVLPVAVLSSGAKSLFKYKRLSANRRNKQRRKQNGAAGSKSGAFVEAFLPF